LTRRAAKAARLDHDCRNCLRIASVVAQSASASVAPSDLERDRWAQILLDQTEAEVDTHAGVHGSRIGSIREPCPG
jgi:hypothetical protein